MADLAEKLAGLSAMPPAALRAEWRRIYRSSAPALSPDLLARGIAYRLQEIHHGALPPTVERQLVRLAARADATSPPASPAAATLRPGTKLVRSWGGQTYHVLVTDRGYVFDDRPYTSLSKIAHAITGTKWSGPRFFGIKGGADPRSRMDGDHA